MKKAFFAFLIIASIAHTLEFKTKTIKVGTQKLKVEMAESEQQQMTGLMFRKVLNEGDGMLFLFPDYKERHFWMKNTFIDLAIGFFDKDKVLFDIQEMKAVKSEMVENPETYPSGGPAKYALEVPAGWFSKHKVKKGDKLVLE